jgi:GntR family transcriptional regulator
VVVRRRVLHDKQTDRVEEIGASYIPTEIAAGTFLEQPQVVPKALFLCVEDLTGKKYHHANDRWVARNASPEEAALLGVAQPVQVIHVVHTAEAEDGTVLEVSESVWPAERIVILDDYPIESGPDDPTTRSDV